MDANRQDAEERRARLVAAVERNEEARRTYERERRKRCPASDRALKELAAARIRAGLTQGEVAAYLGTTQSAISRLEQGRGGIPTLHTIERYATVVGCRIEIKVDASRLPPP